MMCDPYEVVVIMGWIHFSINMRPRCGRNTDENNYSPNFCNDANDVRPLRGRGYYGVDSFFYKYATPLGSGYEWCIIYLETFDIQ